MRKLIVLTLWLSAGRIVAQDAQFSQFYANPLYMNPAMVGASANSRVGINHRVLWPSLPQAFVSSSASFDYHSERLHSSFGILIHQDKEGSASLSNSNFHFTYGYEVRLKDKLVLRPALQFGYVLRGFDPSQLVFGDQIEFGVDGAPSSDPNIHSIRLRDYWDVNTGLLLYSRKYWMGVAVHHLTEPNLSLVEGDNALPMRYSVHAGTRMPLGSKLFRGDTYPTVAPSILYKRQGQFEQLDVGASLHLEPMIFGLYYRGMPFKGVDYDYVNQDALIILVGLDYLNFEFGYSFDMSLSKVDIVLGGGAHELALQYRFQMQGRKKKVSRTSKRLPCPAFLRNLPF